MLPLLLHLIGRELRRDIVGPVLLRRHPAPLRAPVAGELHLPQDHPLVDEPAERFGEGDVAAVVEDLVPEAGIEEVEHGVLRPADVEVDRHPGSLDRRIDEAAFVARIEEPQVVPAGAGPLRHRVGLTAVMPAVAFDKQPLGGRSRQWRIGSVARFEVGEVGKVDRQI